MMLVPSILLFVRFFVRLRADDFFASLVCVVSASKYSNHFAILLQCLLMRCLANVLLQQSDAAAVIPAACICSVGLFNLGVEEEFRYLYQKPCPI